MAYIILPSRRTRQPQYPARVNFAAELAQGIRACFTGVDPALELVNNIRFLPSGSPSKSANQNGLVAVTTSNSADYDGWYAPQQTAGSLSDRLYNVAAPPLTLFVVGNSSNQNLGCGIGRCNGSGNPAWSVGFWAGSSKGAYGSCYAGGLDYLFQVQPTAFIETTVGYHTAVLVISPTTTTVYCDGVADQTAATPAGNFEYQYSDKYRCLSVGGGYKFGSGSFALAGMLRSAWSVDLVREFHRNPWSLFAPDSRRIYFAPSGGGATTTIEPSKGSLVVAGYAPSITQPRTIAPSKGAATLTGYAPGIEQDKAVSPAKGALALTGYAPTLTQPRTIAAVKGTLTLAGYAPGISQSASGTIAPSAGALLLTGHAPGLEQDRNVAPAKGALTLTGGQPGIVQNVTTFIAPSVGALVLLGYTPDVTTTSNQAIAPTQGALLLGGYAPVLAQTGAQTIGPIKGALTLAGHAPTVQVIGTGVTLVEPTVGALTIAGYAPLVRVAVTPPRGGGYSFGTMGGAERRPPQDNARRPS